MDALPTALASPQHRFVPLYRGSKGSTLKGEAWKAGVPFDQKLHEYLSKVGDIGVRLDACEPPLVVLDCDVKRQTDYVTTGNQGTVQTRYEDGTAQLMAWCEENEVQLPPTLWLQSPGREDGSHQPGWHIYYRQNPEWRIRHDPRIAACVDVKFSGIVRITDRTEVMRDLPIAELPLDIAQKLYTPKMLGDHVSGRTSTRTLNDWMSEGYNNTLTYIKGILSGSHTLALDEERVNDIIRYINSKVDHPEQDHVLEQSVLREKGWAVK